MSQTRIKFNINQYQNNHEQGQLLPGDRAKIKQNPQSSQKKNQIINMFKANFVIKLIALSLFIGIVFKYWSQKRQDIAKRKIQNSQVEYLKIVTQQKMVKLAYLKPVVDRPRSVPQSPAKLIAILNTQDFKQFSTSMGSTFQFSTKLYMNWYDDKELFYQVEYLRLNTKYKLDSLVSEKGICVVTTFKDAKKDEQNVSWKMFMKSINQQNYTNYRVYIIDDFSSTNTTGAILNEAPKYPRLNNRLWIVKNLQKIGTLGSKDSVIRNLCQPGEIVIEIDGYDAFIGRQSFNLLNRLYNTSQNVWFAYTNFLTIKKDIEVSGKATKVLTGQINPGTSEAIKKEIFVANSYRTSQMFVTSQLRSYYRDLYMKIPLTHLLERGTGKYFMQASDKFISYALAELAGQKHTFFYPQFNYFSYELNQQKAISIQDCNIPILQRCEYQARILTPLKPLKQLADKVELTQEYHIPEKVMRIYAQKQQIETECIQKKSGVSKIFEDGL